MGRNEKAFAIIVLCGIIGLIFAIILQLLYEQDIFVTQFITGSLTLRETQFVVFLAWEIFGIIGAALVS